MLQIIFYGLLYGFIISVPVGPANIELIKRGINSGFREAFEVGLGAALSDAFLCILVYFGIIKIIMAYKAINVLIGTGCSLLMFYFGFSGIKTIFIDKNKPDVLKYINIKEKPHKTRRSPLLTGFSINTTNPMVIGFWVVFLGAITSSSRMKAGFIEYPNLAIIVFSFFVFSGSLSWFYILSKIVHKGKKYITTSIFELISFICSSLFILFGIILFYGVIKIIFFQ